MILALLLACGEKDTTSDSGAADNDGDGVLAADDCDDDDSALGAVEDDNDCDGALAEDDCDDQDATSHPGADEDYGDGADNDCDGGVDRGESTCSALLTLSDETDTSAQDFCDSWSFDATFEYTADARPEMTSFALEMKAAEGGTCKFTLDQTELCGEGYYLQGEGESGALLATTVSCADFSGSAAWTGEGYVRIDDVNEGIAAGVGASTPHKMGLSAYLAVEGDDGMALEGDIVFEATQLGTEMASTGCAVSDGDEDDDGSIDVVYDGDDCDDDDPLTAPGAAPNDDATACMTDADEDDWGDPEPDGDAEPGTDCDDADAEVYLGVAENEPELCTRDSDDDGWADAGAQEPLEAGDDCNDENADEYPGAVTEASADQCMTDIDGGGFGDAFATGFYDAGTDCDDGDADVYIGSASEEPELCALDVDGDGWADGAASSPYDAGSDCNDADATEYPGAVAEATAGECMNDTDADGYGDDNPGGLYDVGTDCQDGNDDIFPGAATKEPTLCARDSDGDGWGTCSGASGFDAGTDCDDSDATTFPDWAGEDGGCVQDLDGDGYGNITAPTSSSCWDAGTDCDDGDDTAYPGAASAESTLCTIDADADGYGDDTLSSPVDAGTDCDDSDDSVWPDQPGLDVADGVDLDCDGSDFENDAENDIAEFGFEMDTTTSGSGDTYLGTWLEVGDWDNDGADDLYIGGNGDHTEASIGFIVTGPISSWDADIYNASTSHEERTMGTAMGDIDGDGNTDFGVRGWMSTGDYGAVWLGPVTATLDAATADFVLDEGGDYDCFWRFGTKADEDLQFGDVDGDGQDDLIVGSPMWNHECNGGSGVWRGAVQITYGPISTDVTLDDSDVILVGDSYPDTYGSRPRVVDDLDGDGIDDVVSGSSRGGVLHVLTNISSLSTGALDTEATLAVELGPGTRTVACGAGDWDNDGFGDVLLTEAYGTAELILGQTTLTSTSHVDFEMGSGSGALGSGCAGGGDFDGDGKDDVAFQAGYDTAYLVYGGVSGTLDVDTDSDVVLTWSGYPLYNGYEGRPIAFGDFDADGLDDLVIGTPYAATSSDYHGGTVVVYGQ